MKAFKIIGVKNGKPVEKEIENFDEHIAGSEYIVIFDPESYQHEQAERWDR